MILSNNGNLPKPYVDFVEKTCNQKHNEKGCYSATTLIQGVKCTILKDRHFDEITADVADFHNAVMHCEDDSLGENIIAEVLQKGYTYKESVVRHSMVKVAN